MWDVIKKLSFLLDKKQKGKLVILFIITCISAAFEVLGVSLIFPMITAIVNPDIIVENKYIAGICKVLNIHSFTTFVLLCIFAMVFIFVFKNLFLMFQIYIQNRFVCNNRLAMQQRMMRAFLEKPYEYYLNASTGEIVRIVQGDAGQTFNVLTTLLLLGSELVVSLALVITTFVIDPMLTSIVALILVFLAIIIIMVVKPIMKKAGVEFQQSVANTNKWLIQAIQGIKEAKVTRKENFFERKYKESGMVLIKAEKVNTVVTQVPRLLIEMFSVCAMLLAMAFQIMMGRDVQMMIPVLGTFALAAIKLMPSANRIVTSVNIITYNKPAVDSLYRQTIELKQYEEAKKEKERRVVRGHNTELQINEKVEISDITYKYPGADKYVLEDANMVIPVGKSVGIVGTSGAGKTTAVDIVLGLLKPSKGSVLADGKDVMTCYDEWLSNIGYIPQMIFMLDTTIRENIAFGLLPEEIDDAKVWRALEEAQLADYVRSMPEGLDTSIGERGIRVSGGQRQRIGIARALYNDPKLLIFDEATSALDNETEAAIMESIDSLHGKKTIIIIAHRLQTIEGCDMVYRVSDRKITRER